MENEITYGAMCLIPAVAVIGCAVVTKRTLEALLTGTLVAAVILSGTGFFSTWMEALSQEMMDSAYYVLLFGFFGAMIKVLEATGAALGFSKIGTRLAKTRGASLLVTWVLGIIIFIDDYLNSLGVGVAMRNITDQYKVSRELLAYMINSTGAAVCVIIPVSSWGAFMSGQLAGINAVEGLSGLQIYIRAVPYLFYAWAAVLIAPLFALKILPLFGPMKRAEARAQGGQCVPDSSLDGDTGFEMEPKETAPSSAWNFMLPMIVLAAITIQTGDILLGVMGGFFLLALLCFAQRLLTLGKCLDYMVVGFKDMLYVTMMVIVAFMLQDLNEALGLAPYVINAVIPIMNPTFFPVIIFIVVSILAFATGSFWGTAAICFPIAIPLAQALEVNIFLAIGAVVAATAFGSHACFYTDAVTLTSAATQIKNIEYAKTALPLIAVPFVIAIIAYTIAGFILV